VHPKRADEQGSLNTLAKNKWWANSKAQPVVTPVSERQAHGVHVSTWAESWQIPTSLDLHDSGGHRRYTITGAGQTPIPGAASRYFATGMGLQAKNTEGKKGIEVNVLIASARAATEAISKNGLALQHAPPEVRGDKEVVLAAVRQCGSALRYASEDLRGDLDVVREAVKFSATNLRFAAAAIRANSELVMDLLSITQPGTKTDFVAKSVTKPSRLSLQLTGAKRFEGGKGGELTVPAVLVSLEDYECLRKEYCESGGEGGGGERRRERGRQGKGAGRRREAGKRGKGGEGGEGGGIESIADGGHREGEGPPQGRGEGGGEGGGGGEERAETERQSFPKSPPYK
jgi:hypothetical protein